MFLSDSTVDGCEILHHQPDVFFPQQDNGMFTTYQLVDFATIHRINQLYLLQCESVGMIIPNIWKVIKFHGSKPRIGCVSIRFDLIFVFGEKRTAVVVGAARGLRCCLITATNILAPSASTFRAGETVNGAEGGIYI